VAVVLVATVVVVDGISVVVVVPMVVFPGRPVVVVVLLQQSIESGESQNPS